MREMIDQPHFIDTEKLNAGGHFLEVIRATYYEYVVATCLTDINIILG
jgi:hypothetical protein